MSYEADQMKSLSYALRDADGLKNALKNFNSNIGVLERLAIAIEKQNELKELELQLLQQKDNQKVLRKEKY